MDKFIINLLGFYCVLMLLVCILQCYIIILNSKKEMNKVHFYVARDKNGELFLYMGKPFRVIDRFHPHKNGCIITSGSDFPHFGLNKNDYSNLKWEDEPIEAFINIEE